MTSSPRPRIPLWLVLLALAALVAAHLCIEAIRAPRPPAPATASAASVLDGGAARVFFTTPYLANPDTPSRRRQSPLLRAVLDDLRAARRSVDLAVFDLDLPEIGDALLAAAERGVTVRVVLDSHNFEAPETSSVAGQLQAAGVALGTDRREPFMHHKFIVLDDTVVWAGSWNMTANDFRNNNNFSRRTTAPGSKTTAFYCGGLVCCIPIAKRWKGAGGLHHDEDGLGLWFQAAQALEECDEATRGLLDGDGAGRRTGGRHPRDGTGLGGDVNPNKEPVGARRGCHGEPPRTR